MPSGRKKQGIIYLRESGRFIVRSAKKSKDINELIAMTGQLQHWGDFEGALELAKQVVQIGKKDVRGFQLLAVTYFRLNKLPQALSACQQALRLAPGSAVLNVLLATVEAGEKQYTPAKKDWKICCRLSSEIAHRAEKELAIILDKMGEYSGVFPCLHRSAALAQEAPQVQKLDASLVPNTLKNNRLGFTKEVLRRWENVQFDDRNPPVFVMGFMRSGRTLTQEVLGAHPEVFIADEADLIAAVQHEVKRLTGGSGASLGQLQILELGDIKSLRQFYWDRARENFGDDIDNPYFVDKTTMNTIDLGLINTVFPDAKVVFVVCDPRDVCLSCFMQI